jgi:hypothetical protein
VKITFGKVGKEIGTFDSSAERERERESQFVYLASFLSFIPHLA